MMCRHAARNEIEARVRVMLSFLLLMPRLELESPVFGGLRVSVLHRLRDFLDRHVVRKPGYVV